MNKITAEDFWKVWSEPLVEVPPVFYRLYYNEDGSPMCYTMEDLPGNYIDIDKDTYLAGSYSVRVINQKLVSITTTVATKLQPSNSTGTACDPQDVCVVVDESQPHIKWSFQ